ncbi:MAG: LpxA family transferase [Alphaproteobacteria bacterium]|nr:LpxA family transferase [Alphaproteobacteria bacterium]
MTDVRISDYIAAFPASPLAAYGDAPWRLTSDASAIITAIISNLGDAYSIADGVALHRTATVEPGAILKAPIVIGPGALVAAHAYLRGGVWLDEGCIIGPSCEVKSSFLIAGSKIAHLSFVGDSILGAGVNVEAGAMIANYRNEHTDKRIRIDTPHGVIDTGVDKFGALVGDSARIGANAVIAPGALISMGAVIGRLTLVDQSPDE